MKNNMRIIVGLGNPGKKYNNTRHNIGFMVLDKIAEKHGLTWQTNKKFNAEITKYHGAILIKPHTFVNNSGQAVQKVLAYYKLLPKTLGFITNKNSNLSDFLTLIHDDLDIELGKYKISVGSRSAGHRGVNSIIQYLKTKRFKRIRIGIRTEITEKIPAEKFVLQKFSEKELNVINDLISEIIDNELTINH